MHTGDKDSEERRENHERKEEKGGSRSLTASTSPKSVQQHLTWRGSRVRSNPE